MKIIPVVDVLNGIVVHAKAGKRDKYQPLNTPLFSSSNPVDIAIKLEKLGFQNLYLADLDSILKKKTNFKLLEDIRSRANIKLMVDAGVSNRKHALSLFERNVKKVIIATETLRSLDFLQEVVKFFGKEKIILSLDLINGRVLNKFNLEEQKTPLSFLENIENFDISKIIILDLKRVGTNRGVNINLINEILRKFDFDVYVGGGIRNIKELLYLKELGIFGSLIGTALYTKTIDIRDLRKHRLM